MKHSTIAGFLLTPLLLGAAGYLASQDKPLSYAADIEPLFGKRCGDCHSAEEHKADLVLDADKGYGHLVSQPSTQVTTKMLVQPGDAAGSYLWKKLEGMTEIGKGMPRTLFGWKQLPQQELDLVKRWIEEGAQP